MSTAHDDITPSYRPIGRYEWERLVRRISMPDPVKYLAFVLATYADADGSRVRPGHDALAAVMSKTDRTIRRLVRQLTEEYGLLHQVSRGGGRRGAEMASVYQLCVPTDLLDRCTLLTPGDRTPVSPDIQVSGQSEESPVDNSVSPDTQMSGQSEEIAPADVVSPDIQVSAENDFHRTPDAVTERLTGHLRSIDRTPRCPPTTHRPTTKDQPTADLPAQLTTARDAGPESQNAFDTVSEIGPPPARCAHGLVVKHRPDGSRSCALCRRTGHLVEAS